MPDLVLDKSKQEVAENLSLSKRMFFVQKSQLRAGLFHIADRSLGTGSLSTAPSHFTSLQKPIVPMEEV